MSETPACESSQSSGLMVPSCEWRRKFQSESMSTQSFLLRVVSNHIKSKRFEIFTCIVRTKELLSQPAFQLFRHNIIFDRSLRLQVGCSHMPGTWNSCLASCIRVRLTVSIQRKSIRRLHFHPSHHFPVQRTQSWMDEYIKFQSNGFNANGLAFARGSCSSMA